MNEPAPEKKSPLEGESLMLILHPVFLVATIAHLIGFGARWLWRKVFGRKSPPKQST
jgi:hypothetical protein